MVSYLLRLSVTGSLCPSSARLAHAVVRIASGKIKNANELVFAGIGNGVIAKHFLNWNRRVTFVDIEPIFCERFASTTLLDDHRVVCADVVEYLGTSPAQSGRLIVSCLPLHGPFFSARLASTLVEEVKRGGIVVFYSYFPLVPGARLTRIFDNANLVARRERFVAWNLPPAFIYSLMM